MKYVHVYLEDGNQFSFLTNDSFKAMDYMKYKGDLNTCLTFKGFIGADALLYIDVENVNLKFNIPNLNNWTGNTAHNEE